MDKIKEILFPQAVALLKQLIAIPSFSKEETDTAHCLETFLLKQNIPVNRKGNNVWALNKYFDADKPTLLLNSHHDTVKPNAGYTRNPFEATEEAGKLFGLGSNDAGASLVSLLAAFLHFYEREHLKYNIIFAATAEEEISGVNGVASILPELGKINCAIVGEPTQMQMAIAEKGLLVIDCTATGKAGHAARNEGENAIYKAMNDIEWLRNYTFPKVSELLGPVKISVTIINAGNQHNVVPDSCTFTADIRINERYTHEEILETIQQNIQSEIKPRSMRMRSSFIPKEHPLVQAGLALGRTIYGSPTTSDKALMPFPALKMGPGDSARSHTANEFVYLTEIKEGIEIYIQLLSKQIIND
jgi:acetylornithine deacetylase